MSCWRLRRQLAALVTCVLACSSVRAEDQFVSGVGKWELNFFIDTPSNGAPAKKPITLKLTDKDEKVIDGEGWPRDVEADLTGNSPAIPGAGGPHSTYRLTVNIPNKVQKKNATNPVVFIDVKDFIFTYTGWQVVAPLKLTSMNIESIRHDAQTGWYIASVVDTVHDAVGENVDVAFPLLSSMDGADFYSLVDLSVFPMTSPPAMNLGDVFSISNGQSTALPGMFFSSTPFDLDSVSGLLFTPFSGDALVVGQNTLAAIPEPGTLSLLLAGGIVMSLARRKYAPKDTVAPDLMLGEMVADNGGHNGSILQKNVVRNRISRCERGLSTGIRDGRSLFPAKLKGVASSINSLPRCTDQNATV
jgi:hypothetical protein